MSDAARSASSRRTAPLTLAGVPTGFLPWLAADLARAAHGTGNGGRAVIIAADEAAMRALADTVPVFAPEVEVLTLPAWDCLPYDRASPGAAGDGRAAGDAASAAGASARARNCSSPPPMPRPSALLTPFRIRQLTRRLAEGERIERDALVDAAAAPIGYQRDRRGRTMPANLPCAGRSSTCSRRARRPALRLDFFGDEIETMRRFDPADQRIDRQGRGASP